eukprot:9615647-Alexandrium_andersonii.AAC.1
MQRAKLALRVIARTVGQAQSEGPPTRGSVLEAYMSDRPLPCSARASASVQRAQKRVQAWDVRPEAPMRQADPEAPRAKVLAAPRSPGAYAPEGGAYVEGSAADHVVADPTQPSTPYHAPTVFVP